MSGKAATQKVEQAEKPYRGRNILSYCKTDRNRLLAPTITLFTCKNVRLQYIYNEELDDLQKSFQDLRKQVDDRTFKYEIMLNFWFAVHFEKLVAAQ